MTFLHHQRATCSLQWFQWGCEPSCLSWPPPPPSPPPDHIRTAGSCDRTSVEKHGLSDEADGVLLQAVWPSWSLTMQANIRITPQLQIHTGQINGRPLGRRPVFLLVRDSVNSPVLMHNSSELVLQMFTGVGAQNTECSLQQSQIIWIMSSFNEVRIQHVQIINDDQKNK